MRFFFFLLYSLSFFSINVSSQNQVEEFKSKLLNNGKPWILDSLITFKGDSCEYGQTYTFLKGSNKVKLKECMDNKWQTSNLTWELIQENELDLLLKMSNAKTFLVKFVKKGGMEKLRLRELSDKSGTNKDYYFNAR